MAQLDGTELDLMRRYLMGEMVPSTLETKLQKASSLDVCYCFDLPVQWVMMMPC